jgi:hypothetical protein
VLVMDQRRRSAAVEVDRLTSSERDQKVRELGQLDPTVEARAVAVAADRQQLSATDAERAAGIPADCDGGSAKYDTRADVVATGWRTTYTVVSSPSRSRQRVSS